MAVYTTIDKPTDYFDVKLHSGNATSKTLAFDFEVDFYWTKMRNDVYNHLLFDSSRGANKILYADLTATEATGPNTVTFGNSSGITLGTDSSNHGSNKAQTDAGATATYVGWGWKANGGTRTTFTESGNNPGGGHQANTTAGFSIIDYTGTGADGTVAHGLGVAPKCIIIKRRNDTENWIVGHDGIVMGTGRLQLDTTAANGTGNADAYYNTTAPSSTVISLGDHDAVNGNDDTYIIYAFAPIQGYSKFGSYTGNGASDGTFVYTGFKTAWVMVKKTSASGSSWLIFDNKRPGYNGTGHRLYANATDTEDTDTGDSVDLLSNGFKFRGGSSSSNQNAATFIYMAFAEHPFVSSKGVPCTAR